MILKCSCGAPVTGTGRTPAQSEPSSTFRKGCLEGRTVCHLRRSVFTLTAERGGGRFQRDENFEVHPA